MLRCSVSDAGERCSACLRLQEVQSKIRECKELLEELYIQEAHIKSSVNAVHDPIIRNLPLELVPDIFMWCNPNPVNNYEEFGPLPPNAPLAAWRYQFSLSTVCKTWRNIIRSAPQLWTNIYIQFPTKRDDAQKEFLRLSLRLSGTLPLHIHTWLPRNYGPSGREHLMLSSLVEMLNDQSERWKTLDLHVTANFLSLFKGGASGVPSLERLRIRFLSLRNEINEFRVSFGLPSPQIVNIYGISFSSIGIDWRDVTRVKFDTLNAIECLVLFRQAPQLVNLCIGFLECEGFDSGEVVTASNLASWEVGFSDDPDAMLNQLVLPSLVNFEVRNFISFQSDRLAHLVSRSNCPLRRFSLTSQAHGAGFDAIPFLRVTPLLEELVFSYADSHGVHELLDILSRTKLVSCLSQDPNTIFLPHLESLSFIGVRGDPPPWHLVPLLFSPTWHPADARYRPLRMLEFRLSIDDLEVIDYFDKDVLRQLREIQQRDFALRICNKEDNANVDIIRILYEFHFGS